MLGEKITLKFLLIAFVAIVILIFIILFANTHILPILRGTEEPINGQIEEPPLGTLSNPIITGNSVELCLNSRVSYHGRWNDKAQNQWMSNVLWAAGKAPVTGSKRTIYVATKENVYIYNPDTHSLSLHLDGDHRSDDSAAFQIGWSSDNLLDSGVSLQLAELESVALWSGTSSQLASCPRSSDTSYANKNWKTKSKVDMVSSFGVRRVDGLNEKLVAKSSDESLPDPSTNGDVGIEAAIDRGIYGKPIASEDLTMEEMSQLLWSAYGCTPHKTYNKRYGLTVPSAYANYYLTGKIFLVNQNGVYVYHNRNPPKDLSTKDHRIEEIKSGDVREGLQSVISELPKGPCYIIICLDESESSDAFPVLEVGFSSGAVFAQASAMDLTSHFTFDLSDMEKSDIRDLTDIPGQNEPVAIISVGRVGE